MILERSTHVRAAAEEVFAFFAAISCGIGRDEALIDMAPAISPAIAAIRTSLCAAPAAATPTIKFAVETIPSFALRTAALSHPMRETRWFSGWKVAEPITGRVREMCVKLDRS